MSPAPQSAGAGRQGKKAGRGLSSQQRRQERDGRGRALGVDPSKPVKHDAPFSFLKRDAARVLTADILTSQMIILSWTYSLGSSGLPQDSSKAVQLLLKATI